MKNRKNNKNLHALYKSKDISYLWSELRRERVISHPSRGLISPNEYRSIYADTPCPYCNKRMVQGQNHQTNDKRFAIASGYQYEDENGKKRINTVKKRFSKSTYFHPNYISLDHKLNKARFPGEMFKAENLEAVCWKCNNQKGDDNAFLIISRQHRIEKLVSKTLNQYPLL